MRFLNTLDAGTDPAGRLPLPRATEGISVDEMLIGHLDEFRTVVLEIPMGMQDIGRWGPPTGSLVLDAWSNSEATTVVVPSRNEVDIEDLLRHRGLGPGAIVGL